MLLQLKQVLNQKQVAEFRQILENSQFIDGKVTAGQQSALVKNNLQLPQDSPEAQFLGKQIVESLEQNSLFISAALPNKIFPPLFNLYGPGNYFGTHIDNAIRQLPGSNYRIRTDLSATLFLSEPNEYQGGELVIEDTYGLHKIKLPAGDMILYPSSSLHFVEQITEGRRFASFFWLESMVRDDQQRTLLFDLDTAISDLQQNNNSNAVALTGIYHNLLRMWASIS